MAHYYDSDPGGVLRYYPITTTLRGQNITIQSASGLFSAKEVDTATRLLIESAQLPSNAKLLDLGCGNGVVGLVFKRIYPQCQVIMTDVNKRAIGVARKNAKVLGMEVDIKVSDGYNGLDQQRFDVILTNPPYVAGRAVCMRFIDGAWGHLEQGGTLQLVARHTKGGKMLSERMAKVFGNVETLAKKSGFRVYCSVKNPTGDPPQDS